jgi:hypothetical protein
MDSSFDGDDLLTALGTETLAGREMMPEGSDNAPNLRDSMPIELVDGRRFLKVNQTANLRAGSKVSKIWEHGFEHRSLDNWLYNIGAASAVSSAKKLITPERKALADTAIEATECLKAWWDCFGKWPLFVAVPSSGAYEGLKYALGSSLIPQPAVPCDR